MAPSIQIVWLKRDLRLRDNGLIAEAAKHPEPTLFLYVDTAYSFDRLYNQPRQDFIANCVASLASQLDQSGHTLRCIQLDYRSALELLINQFEVKRIITSQQTDGLREFAQEVELNGYLRVQNMPLIEIGKDGIIRRLPNRKNWPLHIEKYLQSPAAESLGLINKVKPWLPSVALPSGFVYPKAVVQGAQYQPGGEGYAHKYMSSFLTNRINLYSKSLSKPEQARYHCSRLSPYLAIGAISPREVYQSLQQYERHTGDSFNSKNFLSRMRWRSHFIQKFEAETEMEFIPYNRAFTKYEVVSNYQTLQNFRNGQTGIPLADACLNCLAHTGYLNFRMRAMLVSVGVFILRLHWRDVGDHLASLFLDYEPGIHYPQVHMQAGLTGTNIVRIYNPHKQLVEHDSTASFTKKWVPQLATLSAETILNINISEEANALAEQRGYKPFRDLTLKLKDAQAHFWAIQKDADILLEAARILEKHSTKSRWA